VHSRSQHLMETNSSNGRLRSSRPILNEAMKSRSPMVLLKFEHQLSNPCPDTMLQESKCFWNTITINYLDIISPLT
jgi:hypothetical protein